jgi:hypothetical protein
MNDRPQVMQAARLVDEAEERETHEAMAEIANEVRRASMHNSEAAAQRQRNLDSALADAVEVVKRHRSRLGRNVCSTHDGAAIRQIWVLLGGMVGADGTSDSDPSFGHQD